MAQCKDCLYHEMCYHTHTSASPICEDFKYKELYVERREGVWVPYRDHINRRQIGWICTSCSAVTNDLSNGDTDFCPHCGAIMKGE